MGDVRPRVVHGDVDPAQSVHRGVDHVADGVPVGQVGLHDEVPVALQRGERALRVVERLDVVHGDTVAPRGERQRDRAADAARRAGHQHGPAARVDGLPAFAHGRIIRKGAPAAAPAASLRRVPAHDVDLGALRAGRLARLQDAMRAHGAEACLFFNQANVRYATGTAAMTVYSSGAFVRCALVPAEGAPILFEHPKLVYRVRDIVDDVRPMPAWEFSDDPDGDARTWAAEITAALSDAGVSSRRLFVDKLGTPAYRALADAGFSVRGHRAGHARRARGEDAAGASLFDVNAGVGMRMLERFEQEMAPGVREQDLLAAMTDTLLLEGGEYLISRACVSGPNTNPWNLEASDRAVEVGDLVFVDTDAVGVEGYFIDVSRTFLCGDVAATRRSARRTASRTTGCRPRSPSSVPA